MTTYYFKSKIFTPVEAQDNTTVAAWINSLAPTTVLMTNLQFQGDGARLYITYS